MKRILIIALGLVAQAALADFDVALSVDGGALQHWTVSADGATWTKGEKNIIASSSARQVAAPGDGYLYVATGNTVDRYQYADSTWSKVDTWKSGLTDKARLMMSPDRVWFYLAGDWSGRTLQRFRVSDPSIGGDFPLSHVFTRGRHFVFGRDGILYCGARGENTDDRRGVMAFDPTVTGAPLLYRYKVDGSGNGVGVVVDDDHGRLCAVYGNASREFGMGGETVLASATTGMTNPFFGVDLGGLKFFGDYSGSVWQRDLAERTTTKKIATVANMCALSDITLVRTADSKLPFINGVWYMNETNGTELVNGANPGQWDMTLSGNAKIGVSGACRGGVLMRGRNGGEGKGVIADSADLVPATGDFTIGLWALVGEDASTERTLFSNGNASIGVATSGEAYFRIGDGSALSISSNRSIERSWVWIVVRRNGGKFEIWVDNVKHAEADYSAESSIASDFDWTLGANPGANGAFSNYVTEAFFDELRVYPALLTTGDMTHLFNLIRPTIYADSSTATVRPAVKAAVGWQISALAEGGTLYAAVNGVLMSRSSSNGSWSSVSDIGLDAASLFADNGTLYAVGRNHDGNLALAKTAFGGAMTWTTPSVIGDGLQVPNLVSTRPIAVNGRIWLGALAQGAWDMSLISFSFANGEAGDPQVSRALIPCRSGTKLQSHVEVTCVQALEQAGGVFVLGASMRSAPERGEAFVTARQGAGSSTLATYAGTYGFTGGSKPFGIVWDATSGRYWMTTAACHCKDWTNVSPFLKATAIALYSSSDLADWTYHGDFTASGATYYYRPTPVAVGNDLVVTFAAERYAETPQSLVVSNFRSLWNKDARRKYELLVADEEDKRVVKYVYDDKTKDWISSGVFCSGTYSDAGGAHKVTLPQTIRQWKDRVFVNDRGTGNLGVFEFMCDGSFVRFYPLSVSTDGLAVSQDGTKIYATVWWGTKVYVIDRATGNVTDHDFGSDKGSGLSVPRGIADIGNGRIAISSRGNNELIIWEPENGNAVTAYGSTNFGAGGWNASGNGPQDIQYDAKRKRLWMMGDACGFCYLDFSAANVTYKRVNSSSYNGFSFWNDQTVVGTVYSPGRLCMHTYDTVHDTCGGARACDAVCGSRLINRLATIKRSTGMMLVVR